MLWQSLEPLSWDDSCFFTVFFSVDFSHRVGGTFHSGEATDVLFSCDATKVSLKPPHFYIELTRRFYLSTEILFGGF